MTRLRLDPDQLRVEPFAPEDGAAGPRGTVAGHSGDAGATDVDLLTCAGSCPPDCGHAAPVRDHERRPGGVHLLVSRKVLLDPRRPRVLALMAPSPTPFNPGSIP